MSKRTMAWGLKQTVAYGVLAAVSLFMMVEYLSAVYAAAPLERQRACQALEPREMSVEAPDFLLPDLAGKKLRLSSLRGKVVLLNFWATWCPPCVEELPSIIGLHQADLGDNFKLLTVSVDEELPKVKALLAKFGAAGKSLPVVIDPTKKVATSFGTSKFPETYLIDKKGVIRYRFINKRHWTSPEALQCIRSLQK